MTQDALTYSCNCVDGSQPDLSIYAGSLESLACNAYVAQCVAGNTTNPHNQKICTSTKCGTKDPSSAPNHPQSHSSQASTVHSTSVPATTLPSESSSIQTPHSTTLRRSSSTTSSVSTKSPTSVGTPGPSSTTFKNPNPTDLSKGPKQSQTQVNSQEGLSTGAKAGIGVGVALGVLIFVGLGVYLGFRRGKASKSGFPEQTDTQTLEDAGVVVRPGFSGQIREVSAEPVPSRFSERSQHEMREGSRQ
jgi:hypothetical protein